MQCYKTSVIKNPARVLKTGRVFLICFNYSAIA